MEVRRLAVLQLVAAALLTVAIGLWAISPAPAQMAGGRTVVLVGARIIDGTGAPPLEDGTIVIASDGRIAAVGPRSAIRVTADAVRIPMAGKTIMPGLINAHGHLNVDA